MNIVGVDPGKTGGVCLLSELGSILDMRPMMTTQGFAEWLMGVRVYYPHFYVFLEKAQVFPKNGAVGMFHYGDGFGQLQGVLIALGAAYTLVPPQAWTRDMLAAPGDGKERNVASAHRLAPGVSFVAPRGRKPHLGMVDAFLIAEWGRRQMTQATQGGAA